MDKIFSTEQVRRADSFTISHEPIASIDLMERAATACFNWITHKLKGNKATFFILCGPGNNGGDGLALARMLHFSGHEVKTAIPAETAKYSPDFSINLERLKNSGAALYDLEGIAGWNPTEEDFIVDALFGSGLSKPLEGKMAEVVNWINHQRAVVIAVDIPSGLFSNSPLPQGSKVVNADYTLSFQFPKLSFLFSENDAFTGEWAVLPIGLSKDFIEEEPCNHFLISRADVLEFLRPRKRFSHKGTFGHALLIAGSQGKMGAAVLASLGCLRSGTGLLTTHSPACGYEILQTAVPEAMVSVDPGLTECSRIPDLAPYSAIGMGPGIGKSKEAANALRLLLQEARVPLVLDADALNILAEQKTWQGFLPAGSILTPHPGEFSRLAGKSAGGFETLELLREYCSRHRVYVLLKGAYSVTCTPGGNCYFNPSGNPGMATGGSGDVLTGIILGLLAQHYAPVEACIMGAYLHGLAGDLAARKFGQEAMIAGDITNALGEAFKYTYGIASGDSLQ